MRYRLEISREESWRGCRLDTVTPIAEVLLAPPIDCPEILHAEYGLKLTNGKTALVSCGWSSCAGFGIRISTETMKETSIRSGSPIYMEMSMPDDWLYIFKISESDGRDL